MEAFLIFIYIFIGAVVSLLFHAYYCWDYKTNYKGYYKDFKNYLREKELIDTPILIMVWPLVLIIGGSIKGFMWLRRYIEETII